MKLSGKWVTVPLVRKVIGMPGHKPSAYNSCIGGELRGKGRINRETWMSAVNKCKGRRG